MAVGRYWILISGIILMMLGIVVVATSYSAADFVQSTFNTVCSTVTDSNACISAQATADCEKQCPPGAGQKECNVNCQSHFSTQVYTSEMCEVSIRSGAGCACPSDEDPSQCDCSGQILGYLEQYWRIACMALGALGLVGATFFTGLPAIILTYRHYRCCNVTCFSVMSGILFLIFLIIGAAFISISVAFKSSSTVKDFLNNCEADLSPSSTSADTKKYTDCATESFCKGIRSLSNDIVMKSLGVGIPYFVSGVLMLFGMYACCCCYHDLPQKQKLQAEEGQTDVEEIPDEITFRE